MRHGNDPRRLGAIDLFQVVDQPLVLLVRGVVVNLVVLNLAKGARVGDKGLRCRGVRLVGIVALGNVARKGPLGTVGEIGLAIQRDEVRGTNVEGVPETGDAARLLARGAEAVLVGRKVSMRLFRA